MSFLKDFKEELSQAVNELVNIDENEADETSDKSVKEESKEATKTKGKSKTKKNVNDNSEPTVKASDESEEVNTLDSKLSEQFKSNLNAETLDELFGNKDDKQSYNESQTDDNMEKSDYEEFAQSEVIDSDNNEEKSDSADIEDVKFDNIDISEYIEEREKAYGEPEKEDTFIKEIANNIQSKINDDKLEEMMADDRESKKAALRGMRQEENYTQRDDEGVSLATEEVAEVTRGTMIDGNIVSEGSMNVYGKIKGNVACRGKLVVCGTIVGSSRGAEIFTNNAKIDGDVTSDGSIKVGNGTVIIGNVYGTSAVIAGAVQGDIDVHGPVIIDGTAVVQGNIRSRSVQINNGAAIEGMISQCYADIDYAALFDKTFSKS